MFLLRGSIVIFAPMSIPVIPTEKHRLEPFLPNGARLLMLGSFPPKHDRWSMEFFYPNWINDMWRIMGHIFYGDKHYFEVRNDLTSSVWWRFAPRGALRYTIRQARCAGSRIMLRTSFSRLLPPPMCRHCCKRCLIAVLW